MDWAREVRNDAWNKETGIKRNLDYAAIGKRIESLPGIMGITLTEFARRLETKRTSVLNWVRGNTKVPLEFVIACQDVFGVSMEWLVFGAGKKFR